MFGFRFTYGDISSKIREWSPDGNWIAFTSTRRWEGKVGVSGIFIMRPDGTNVRMLTNEPPLIEGGSDANYPVWRPEPVKS